MPGKVKMDYSLQGLEYLSDPLLGFQMLFPFCLITGLGQGTLQNIMPCPCAFS